MKFKFSIFCFAMLALNASQAKAEESQFIYEGRIDALYGYNMPSNRYKHNSPRDKTIYNLSLNLGWEKEFNDVRKLGLYADLNAGINRDMYNYNNGNWGQELYAIYDDGSRKEIGEVGHNISFYINTPQDEEKIVSSLNISKLEPSYGNKVKTSETTDGAYTVYSYKKEAVTRSSQSTHVFTGYWDEIIYTDEFGQEVDFTVFEWQFSEVSGTFSDLAEENNYERKLFTSVMNGKFIDSKDYTVKVIFKKQKDCKLLIS